MRRGLALVLGFLLISGGLLFTREGRGSPIRFTLAMPGGEALSIDSPGTSFRLAGKSVATAGYTNSSTSGDFQDGAGNTAYGIGTLANLTPSEVLGRDNSAFGYRALSSIADANDNTAIGSLALAANNGFANTATGAFALGANTTGTGNCAYGRSALIENSTGGNNTAIGMLALADNSTGNWNTALGSCAGRRTSYVDGNFNIFLGARVPWQDGDTNTIRIGFPYILIDNQDASRAPAGQNRTFIAGIVENPIDASLSPSVVGITSDARLGTIPVSSLPQGPKGDTGAIGATGPAGPRGPAGPGPVPGSVIMLPTNIAPPAGYVLLGTTSYLVRQPNGRMTLLNVSVFQKI